MRVNFERVVKQGILSKKGSILGLYNNECLVYLEKGTSSAGPVLKYGPKRKPVAYNVDLNNSIAIALLRTPGSKTKFQIVTPDGKLKFKAMNSQEREQWLSALAKEVGVAISDEKNVTIDAKSKKKPSDKHDTALRRLQEESPSPTLSQINDLLLEHENMLHAKIGQSQESYERYSQDMSSLESELEKKYRERFTKMKNSSEAFLQH